MQRERAPNPRRAAADAGSRDWRDRAWLAARRGPAHPRPGRGRGAAARAGRKGPGRARQARHARADQLPPAFPRAHPPRTLRQHADGSLAALRAPAGRPRPGRRRRLSAHHDRHPGDAAHGDHLRGRRCEPLPGLRRSGNRGRVPGLRGLRPARGGVGIHARPAAGRGHPLRPGDLSRSAPGTDHGATGAGPCAASGGGERVGGALCRSRRAGAFPGGSLGAQPLQRRIPSGTAGARRALGPAVLHASQRDAHSDRHRRGLLREAQPHATPARPGPADAPARRLSRGLARRGGYPSRGRGRHLRDSQPALQPQARQRYSAPAQDARRRRQPGARLRRLRFQRFAQ